MRTDVPSRLRRVRRAMFPREERAVGPPRPGTSREDMRTFITLIVVATTISVAGVVYALWAYG